MFLSLTDTGNLCEIFFFLFSFNNKESCISGAVVSALPQKIKK